MLPPSLQDSLPAGWLAFAGRASTLWIAAKGFRSHSHPPFLDLSWRKGSFISNLPSHHSITSSARASSIGRLSSPSVFAVREYAERAAYLARFQTASTTTPCPIDATGRIPSSASRFAAGAAGFLLLSQSGE